MLQLNLSWLLYATFMSFTIISQVNSYNFLFWSQFSSKSHRHVLDPVAEELGKKGHNVVMFTSIDDKTVRKNVKEIYDPDADKILNRKEFHFFNDKEMMKLLIETCRGIANASYSHPFVQDLIRNPKDPETNTPKFDVVIVDGTFNEQALPIAHHMGTPVVIFSTTAMFYHHAWLMNIPYPLSYLSTFAFNVTKPMSFIQRGINAIMSQFYYRMFFLNQLYKENDRIIKNYLSNAPQLSELTNQVSFVISHDHFSLTSVAPTMPYYVQLGGIHCKPAKPLPKGLEDFVQSSGEHGVVFFSLGSHTTHEFMPPNMMENLVYAFSQIPQKVIWKHEDKIEGASSNIKFFKWIPQGDLLAHPKMRVFVTHGGMLSCQEAAYHGCPFLGLPLQSEQVGNIQNLVAKGFGEMVRWQSFTAEEFLGKLKKVINDKRYKDAAQKMSFVFKDRPQSPIDTAVYWIEYIARHKGAPHLKSDAEYLNTFQYFLLDIIGAIAAIIAVAAFVLACLLKIILRCIKPKQQTPIHKKKQ